MAVGFSAYRIQAVAVGVADITGCAHYNAVAQSVITKQKVRTAHLTRLPRRSTGSETEVERCTTTPA
jgi:hypothetical protein